MKNHQQTSAKQSLCNSKILSATEMYRHLAILFTVLFFSLNTNAQNELKLPESDPDLAKQKYVLVTDNYNDGNYSGAYEALLWIMENAPDIHESVYIAGQKAIKKLIEHDPSNNELKNKLMETYDLRIKHFGDEVDVLGRKAFDAYKYMQNDELRIDEIVTIYDHLYNITKMEMPTNLLFPYFDLKIDQYQNGEIDEQELINSYQNISEIIQYKIDNGEQDAEKSQNLIDSKLVQVMKMNCMDINKLLIGEKQPDQLSLQQAKLVIKLSLAYSCIDEPYFIEAIKILYVTEPSIKLARLIASSYIEKKDYEKALRYFEQSLEQTKDNEEKASVYFDIAKVYYAMNNKIKSREMANAALALDPNNLESYRLIGDLYFNSFEDCKKGVSHTLDRSIFYAAYDKYQLANDPAKMAMAEQQFPAMEEIHQENYQEGQIINTNCWMGEPVKIRRRPNLTSN